MSSLLVDQIDHFICSNISSAPIIRVCVLFKSRLGYSNEKLALILIYLLRKIFNISFRTLMYRFGDTEKTRLFINRRCRILSEEVKRRALCFLAPKLRSF